MSEWFSKSLSHLASFQKGRKVETSEHLRDGFMPYLGASAISGTIEEYADVRFGVTAVSGDVLMLWDGERSGLVGKAQNGVISSTVARLTTKGEVEGDFLYYALSAKFDWIQNRRTGTGVPHVPKDLGRILAVSFPKDVREQRRIAEILSTVDGAIEQTEALIAKYQQIKAGLMHDLFTRGVTLDGHLRPTHKQAPHLYKDSPLGWIPKEWDGAHIEDLCSDVVDCPHSTPTYGTSGVPCIRTADLQPGVLLLDQAYKVTEEEYRERVARLAPQKGDIIYSREGERLGIASPVGHERVCLGQRVMLLRPGTATDPDFLLWAMNTSAFYRKIVLGLGATTSPHVNVGDIRKAVIVRPPAVEQEMIGRVLVRHNILIGTEEIHLAKLCQQKQGLMHDLLTGRVRVKVADPVTR